jgi:hypothetical protein
MKDFLKKAFPFLTIAASAVPGGNLAMSALGQILKVTPSDGKAVSWDDLGAAVINAPPEIRVALQAEENRHVEAMKQMGVNSAEEFERIAAGDRANARDREVKTGDKWTPRILAGVVLVLYVTIQLSLLRIIIDPSMREMVMRSMGTLDAAVGLVLGYYFGSSAGSAAKDETIKKQVGQ